VDNAAKPITAQENARKRIGRNIRNPAHQEENDREIKDGDISRSAEFAFSLLYM